MNTLACVSPQRDCATSFTSGFFYSKDPTWSTSQTQKCFENVFEFSKIFACILFCVPFWAVHRIINNFHDDCPFKVSRKSATLPTVCHAKFDRSRACCKHWESTYVVKCLVSCIDMTHALMHSYKQIQMSTYLTHQRATPAGVGSTGPEI